MVPDHGPLYHRSMLIVYYPMHVHINYAWHTLQRRRRFHEPTDADLSLSLSLTFLFPAGFMQEVHFGSFAYKEGAVRKV